MKQISQVQTPRTRKKIHSAMKFVHMISQGCSIFKSFEAQLTVHCGILFMLMYSIEMNFQVVWVRENFLAKLTCSFIKQAYKENIKGDRDTKKILYFLLLVFMEFAVVHFQSL